VPAQLARAALSSKLLASAIRQHGCAADGMKGERVGTNSYICNFSGIVNSVPPEAHTKRACAFAAPPLMRMDPACDFRFLVHEKRTIENLHIQ
jgi:hypothetical protein